MGEWIGRSCVVGVAINADNGGTTEGGTPGSYEYFLAMSDGVEVQMNGEQAHPDGDMDVDPQYIETGGVYYSGKIKAKGSYSYREKLWQLILGGSITTAGSGPYVHTIALSDDPLFGALKIFFSDPAANANEFRCWSLTDVLVTDASITQSMDGQAEMEFSWLAKSCSKSTNEASIPSANLPELMSWRHLAVTLNGTAVRVAAANVHVAAPASEDDMFSMAATNPAVPDFMDRGGPRVVDCGMDLRMNNTNEALLATPASELTSGIVYNWDNGGATTSNRDLTITIGNAKFQSRSTQLAKWGRITESVKFLARDATSPRVIAVAFTNGRSSIPS